MLRKLSVAVEQNPASVVITDLNACIQYVNPRFTEITGYTAAEAIGQTPRILQSGQTPKKTYSKLWGKLTSGQIWHGELFNKRKNGELFWEDVQIAPVKNTAGTITHYVAVKTDITERKQVEAALQESEFRWKFAIEGSGDGLWDWNVAENTVFFTKRWKEMLGFAEDEIGNGLDEWEKRIHPDDKAEVFAMIQAYFDGKIPGYINEHRVLCKDGSYKWILDRGIVVSRSEDGKPLRMIGTHTDITVRKEFEAELLRSNAELEQFSYAVSHDMRQPLRMISSYLQLIELGLADQLIGEKRDYFNYAIDGAKRIDQMLVALLEYSRVGRMGEPPTWIDSRAALDEALQFLQPAIAEAQAKLNVSGDWPHIFASHDEILRLLQNLIGNSVKYRIAGRIPEITVTSEVVGNEWHLYVADNGVGIIPEQIKRLFKVFQRLHTRDAYEGTGIGLALCRKVAEHHKGRIWAESAGEGLGSRFCVVLPLRGGVDNALEDNNSPREAQAHE
jgi:PAS domain S-box-containing protein